MMPTGVKDRVLAVNKRFVSILVLLDDAYRPAKYLTGRLKPERFQSLFFWMMPTGSGALSIPDYADNVSILVLLDDAYRPFDYWIDDEPIAKVSILVLLDDAYRQRFQIL